MLYARPEGFVGKQFAEGFTSYVIAGPYCGVVSLEDGVTQDEGKQLLESFKQGLLSADVQSLADFESVISKLILSLNFPVHIALAIGLHLNGILYVKTVGDGQIYFRRSNKMDLLLSGDKSASGYLKEFDMAIFTTSTIHNMIGETADIQAFIELNSPREIVEKIQAEEYGDEEQGFVSLFVEFTQKKTPSAPSILDDMEPKINDPMAQNDLPPEPIEQIPAGGVMVPPQIGTPAVLDQQSVNTSPSLKDRLRKIIRNKIFIVSIVLVLFGLLSWSVFFGYQRRQAEALRQKIQETRVAVEAQMAEARDISFLNLQESLVLIADAKTTVTALKEDAGDGFLSEIEDIEGLIAETESAIMKRDEVEAGEFYDLSLEAQDARGDALGKEDTTVAILDTEEEKVYVLDLERKSLDEYVSPDLSDSSVVALYNGQVYILHATKGVMKFTSQTELSTVIESDDEWGKITDMELYSGNIYLLDAGKEEIYKYLVTEGGFSDKRPYLTTQVDISEGVDMIIDSAIYVVGAGDSFKFISGVRESFTPQLPVENPIFDRVYTNPDIQQVYVLDTKHASVYILSKEGEYQRQVQSSVFGSARGMYVFEDTIHVLTDTKIYDVPLNE